MDIHSLLVTIHIIGTVLGVGGATFAEIFHIKAMRDGVVDAVEGGFLKLTYTTMRIGLALAVLSGFGFLLLLRLSDRADILYSEPLLAKMTIVALLVINAILLHLHLIPFRWGASISLVSWYAALLIGSWRGIPFSYLTILGIYALVVIAMVPLLEKLRHFFAGKTKPS